jgi:predicted ATP-grasp superfamily ATP-dependent carboligase
LAVTGVAGTAELGDAVQNSIYLVTGVSGTGQIGTVAVEVAYLVTGVSAIGSVGSQSPAVNVWGLINTNQNANWIQIAA